MLSRISEKKRFLAVFMSLIMVVGVCPVYAGDIGYGDHFDTRAESDYDYDLPETAVEDDSDHPEIAPVQEYIVFARNDDGTELAEYFGDVVEEEAEGTEEIAESLEDNNVSIVELTETEAELIERDRDILIVEENIQLEGSEVDDSFELEPADLTPEEELQLKMMLKEAREEATSVSAEDQWNIDMVNSNHGEYESVSGNHIKVAVIDSGVTASDDIPVAERINFIDGQDSIEPLFDDLSGHGTSVAGVIVGRDNGTGITGINPNAELYSLRVLDMNNRAPLSRILSAIYWCIDNDIDIINMSFGTTTRSAVLEKAIRDASDAGILMIAAVGNHGMEDPNVVEYPAAFDEVMAVGALNTQGQVSELSSVGHVTEILAPGEKVPAMDFFDQVIPTDGTSVATPHITGIASVLWGKDETKSADYIRQLMKASARPIGEDIPYGVADLDYALQIYDSFAEEYTSNPKAAVSSVSENSLSPEAYDDVQVEALWYSTQHKEAVNASTSINATVKRIFCKAQEVADKSDILKSSNAEQQRFHGWYNYMANYVYMMRIARKVYSCSGTTGMETAIDQALWPLTTNDQGSPGYIKDRLKRIPYEQYLLDVGIQDTAKNRGRFIAGLAVHTAMDAYAHRSYVASGNTFVAITKESKNRDNKNFCPNRYEVAKRVALSIVDVWHYGYTPSEHEFIQSNHDGTKFRLGNLSKNAKKLNPNLTMTEDWWLNNHTYDY